jgi:hypothetical protein
MIDRNRIVRPAEHLHRQTLMVSASAYYRQRADIHRGLQKRDFPCANDPTPSERADEAKVIAMETLGPEARWPSATKH